MVLVRVVPRYGTSVMTEAYIVVRHRATKLMYEGRGVRMYTLSDATPVVAGVTTAVVLPNTGVASNVVSLAVAVVIGMVVWGVMYARANR